VARNRLQSRAVDVAADGAPGDSILVVDDDAPLRALVCSLLESAGYRALEATTGEEALQLTTREQPRLVVLDVVLPGISGYQVCRSLRDRFGDGLPIIFVSGVRTHSLDRVAGLLLGADEYLEKPFAPDELLIRVARLVRRSAPVSPAVAARLTRREREVLSFISAGLDVRDIAARMHVSPKTVGTHIENIYRKLGVHTRAQALARAYDHGVA
jgi:DNA-binding response OmpR family regulator